MCSSGADVALGLDRTYLDHLHNEIVRLVL